MIETCNKYIFILGLTLMLHMVSVKASIPLCFKKSLKNQEMYSNFESLFDIFSVKQCIIDRFLTLIQQFLT